MSMELPLDCDPRETLFEDLVAAAWDLCSDIPDVDGTYEPEGIDLIYPPKTKATDRTCESVAVAAIFLLARSLLNSLDWQDEDRRTRATGNYNKLRQAWDLYNEFEGTLAEPNDGSRSS